MPSLVTWAGRYDLIFLLLLLMCVKLIQLTTNAGRSSNVLDFFFKIIFYLFFLHCWPFSVVLTLGERLDKLGRSIHFHSSSSCFENPLEYPLRHNARIWTSFSEKIRSGRKKTFDSSEVFGLLKRSQILSHNQSNLHDFFASLELLAS